MKFKHIITRFALFSIVAMGPIAFVAGCSTNATQTTIKAEGALITSVNVGMEAWAAYVRLHVSDGKVTQKQVDAVKEAYNAYYAAQQAAKAAIEKVLANGSTNSVDASTANAAVAQADASLLSVLNQYITQK